MYYVGSVGSAHACDVAMLRAIALLFFCLPSPYSYVHTCTFRLLVGFMNARGFKRVVTTTVTFSVINVWVTNFQQILEILSPRIHEA